MDGWMNEWVNEGRKEGMNGMNEMNEMKNTSVIKNSNNNNYLI
jgi:hypothetical protein